MGYHFVVSIFMQYDLYSVSITTISVVLSCNPAYTRYRLLPSYLIIYAILLWFGTDYCHIDTVIPLFYLIIYAHGRTFEGENVDNSAIANTNGMDIAIYAIYIPLYLWHSHCYYCNPGANYLWHDHCIIMQVPCQLIMARSLYNNALFVPTALCNKDARKKMKRDSDSVSPKTPA